MMTVYHTEADVPAVWEVGDVILDKYEVTGILGEGGMGRVYKVHHRGFQVDLAVKCPKPDIFARDKGKENFMREAANWVQLDLHPHTVTCHYVRMLGGIPRLFAEYVEGGTLADWIRSRKLYEGGHNKAVERMLDVMIQFAWGLHYAHEQGLVHQDIKPGNVMMSPDGMAKVTDFGLAKARVMVEEGQPSRSVSMIGTGTQYYLSPEQGSGQRLGRKTDIWSWGVSVLHMFMGEVTWWTGLVADEVLKEVYLKKGPQTRDASRIPPMPAGVVDLLRHCFQREPDKRPATMADVADRLIEIYQQEMGCSYFRERPQAADALADNLNNRALSLMDLGKVDEALKLWQEALKIAPPHIEAIYNLEVARWKQGFLTDEGLVPRLQDVCNEREESWLPKYLLAMIHFTRGDVEAAQPLLEAARRQAPDESEVQAALDLARSNEMARGKTRPRWELHKHLEFFAWRLARLWSYEESSQLDSSRNDRQKKKLFRSAEEALQKKRFDTALTLMQKARLECSSPNMAAWVKLYRVCPRVGLRAACLARTFQGHTSPVKSVSFSADGRFCLAGFDDGTLRRRDLQQDRFQRPFQGHTSPVRSVSFSADGRFCLSGSDDRRLRLWDVATADCLRTFEGHASYVRSVSLSADGGFCLSGSDDGTLRLWDVATAHCLRIFQRQSDWITAVSFSADGRFCLSGSSDGTLWLWDVATGRCLHSLLEHTDWITSVSFSADGHFCLSASYDRTLRLWDRKQDRFLPPFQGHTSPVRSVSFSADGRFCLSGSDDKTVRLWDVQQSRCLRTFEGHTLAVKSVSFSADGRFCLAGFDDGTVKQWALDWELEAREPANWDEGARPYLSNFLTLHTPRPPLFPPPRLVLTLTKEGLGGISGARQPTEEEITGALTRRGQPTWNQEQFQGLIRQLEYAGYGWLRPEGVQAQLSQMARRWTEPPPLG
jgi:WD40 repeat protein/serine/threonine protein kinase